MASGTLPKPLPASDNYLNQILLHLKSVLPNFQYNSVLITKYDNVSDSLGFHSDNEPEIMLNSDIVTISFSQSRIAKLRSISASGDCPEQELTLHHEDVVMMSRNSQDFFQHAIIPDDSCKLRISITRWMLRDSFVTPIMHAPDTDHVLTQANCTSPLNEAKNDTLYIGDSMLKHLNSKKMSSLSQKAHVFAYSGATAGGILSKLKSDPEFLKLDPLKYLKSMFFVVPIM